MNDCHKDAKTKTFAKKYFFVRLTYFLPLWLIAALSFSCNKEKWFGGPNYMHEDFESYLHVDSMFTPLDEHWSYNQNTVDGNFLSFDTSIVHSGNKSLRFFAYASPSDNVSKNSIVKQHMAFYEGDVVRISAWYYVEGTAPADWLFLFDFEEQAAIGAGPGIRLATTEANGMVVEHKFYEDDIYQTPGQEVLIPRNQWFNLTMEVKLTQKKKGTVKVWQDNQLIIDKSETKTLPKDFLYSQQGTKGMYTSIEFGITANTKDRDVVLYMDDILVEKIN